MEISPYRLQKIRDFVFFVLTSAFMGGAFACVMTYAATGTFSPDDARYMGLGVCAGLAISTGILLLDDLYVKKAVRPLWFSFTVVPLMQTAVIVGLYGTVFAAIVGVEYMEKEAFLPQTLAFSLVLTAVLNFGSNVERLLGKHVLRGLVLGTYRVPKKENRFVMFLDLAGSTATAERLGDLEFHAFLNDFFSDIARPIVNFGGEIYKYVGDEAIVTWKEKAGAKNRAALASFGAILEAIRKRSAYYERRYGLVPEFRAGLHFGPVIAGEMGLTRQEIAFSGDVMNTAARIQAECRQLGERFLVSDDALALLCPKEPEGLAGRKGRAMPAGSAPAVCEIVSRGAATLRGKTKEIGISAVR